MAGLVPRRTKREVCGARSVHNAFGAVILEAKDGAEAANI
jgi:hypothetical protein